MPGGSEHDCPQHPELPMGGNVPLGYNVKDRKLVVNEPETSTGRVFLGRYNARNRQRLGQLGNLREFP
jgi:hypothetical protein